MTEKLEELIEKASTHVDNQENGALVRSDRKAAARKWLLGLSLVLLLINVAVILLQRQQQSAELLSAVQELFELANNQVLDEYRNSGALPQSLENPVFVDLVRYSVRGGNQYELAYTEEGKEYSVTLSAEQEFTPEMLR
jgi:hypothetical protein